MLNDTSIAIADGLEPIVLRRYGTDLLREISGALKRRARRQEQASIPGIVPSIWKSWYLPMSGDAACPQCGDEIVDSDGVCWSVYEVEDSETVNTWKCLAFSFAIPFGLDEYVDLFRKVSFKSPAGAEETNWCLLERGIPCRMSDATVRNGVFKQKDAVENRVESETRLAVIRGPIELESTDRIRDGQGMYFRILKVHRPQFSDGWTELELERV